MHIFESTINAGNVKNIKNREGSTVAVGYCSPDFHKNCVLTSLILIVCCLSELNKLMNEEA